MDRSWINSRRFSKEHVDGVKEFMTFVSQRFNDDEEMLCPCRECLNRVRKPQGQVEDDLYINGMASTYTRWIHHGEPLDAILHENEDHADEQTSINEDFGMNVDEQDDPDDGMYDMVQELYRAEDEGQRKKSMFAIILEEMKQQLHPGGKSTRFSFVVKLLHIKSFYRITNVAFTALLKLLSEEFPNCSIPATYEEAKRLIRALGLGYDSIHVCPNNCVLFRKELAKKDVCPVCNASRWEENDGKKKIPMKVLRHFPLIPRLKRIFSSKKMSEEVQWHKLKRKPVENELSHPADGEEIIELRYNSDSNDDRTVVLFRCDWFDTHGKKFRMKDDRIFRSINHGSFWYKNDPFILATMAKKVFYLEDTKYHEKWRVVQKFSHRHLWNVAENDRDDIPNVLSLSYQDDECEGGVQVYLPE